MIVFDSRTGRRRGAGGRFLAFSGTTKLVCASCRKVWRGAGSPALCPDCGKTSYPISVLRQPKKVKHRRRTKWKLK